MQNHQSFERYDVAIIGGGPGGAVLGTYLAEAGLSVVIIERQDFPRYHIGESLTGLAGEIIEAFGLTEHMREMQFPPKGGVKVIGSGAKSEFFVPVLRPTWQVRRAEFDAMLLDHACRRGVALIRGTVRDVLQQQQRVVGLTYETRDHGANTARQLQCSVTVDASGQGTVLSRLGVAGTRQPTLDFCRQTALFTQVRYAKRDPGSMGDNTFIFYDKAHHWAWFIPLSPDLVSVGVVMPNTRVKDAGGSRQAAFDWGIAHINPDLTHRMHRCEYVEPVRAIQNFSYCIDPFTGPGWLCVGDAHRFIDPIFSFGVSFAMIEARAAAGAIQAALETGDDLQPFADYARYCNTGQDAAFDLIRYFWKYPIFFGYQMRGSLRKDIIRMLGSDMHHPDQLQAMAFMRTALRQETRASRSPVTA